MDTETKARIVRLEDGLRRVEVMLNNGMTDSLTRIDARVERIDERMNAMITDFAHTEDPAVRLAHCPYRKHVEEKVGNRQKFWLAVYALIVAAAAGAPAWIVLFNR